MEEIFAHMQLSQDIPFKETSLFLPRVSVFDLFKFC